MSRIVVLGRSLLSLTYEPCDSLLLILPIIRIFPTAFSFLEGLKKSLIGAIIELTTPLTPPKPTSCWVVDRLLGSVLYPSTPKLFLSCL